MHEQKFRVALVLGFSLSAGAPTQDEGHKRADEHIQKIERASEEASEIRKRLEKAFDAYRETLREGVDERRSSYKDLAKALERCEERTKELRKRHEEMDEGAEEFFKKWKDSSEDIRNGDLKRRSEGRLEATRRHYRQVSESLKRMAEAYEPVLFEMRDQVVYLRHDLNDDAVRSLQEDATELQGLASELFRSMDGFRSTADAYIGGLEPR